MLSQDADRCDAAAVDCRFRSAPLLPAAPLAPDRARAGAAGGIAIPPAREAQPCPDPACASPDAADRTAPAGFEAFLGVASIVTCALVAFAISLALDGLGLVPRSAAAHLARREPTLAAAPASAAEVTVRNPSPAVAWHISVPGTDCAARRDLLARVSSPASGGALHVPLPPCADASPSQGLARPLGPQRL